MSQLTLIKPVQDDGATKNTASSKPVTSAKRHPKFCFDALISIQIEDTLFNIHKHQLMKSTTFSDMFAVAAESSDPQKNREGLSLDHPIVMLGVSALDFECLMTVLYARRVNLLSLYLGSAAPLTTRLISSQFCTHNLPPEAPLIVPAFRLANMWDFTGLRASLMPLAEKELDDVDKILFARQFGIEEWLVPAYTRLCQRNESLTTEEAHKLGIDALLFIYRTREELGLASPEWSRPGCSCDRQRLICGLCSGTLIYARNPTPGVDTIQEKVKAWMENGHTM